MNAFAVVRQFEGAVADFAGAKYGVAVNSGTNALFLSMKYCAHRYGSAPVSLPAHTFISVPMAAKECGFPLSFSDEAWEGVYRVKPYEIWDSALRFKRGMYQGGLHCLSFQARKILNIGEGGMVLTDDDDSAEWIRRASYCGRGAPDYSVESIETPGWNMYMTPEKAARGLHLMEYIGDGEDDQKVSYPDLRKVPYFQ